MKFLCGYYSMIKDILVGPLNASFFCKKSHEDKEVIYKRIFHDGTNLMLSCYRFFIFLLFYENPDTGCEEYPNVKNLRKASSYGAFIVLP